MAGVANEKRKYIISRKISTEKETLKRHWKNKGLKSENSDLIKEKGLD